MKQSQRQRLSALSYGVLASKCSMWFVETHKARRVKPATKIEGGTGATFVTIEEDVKINKKTNEKLKASEKKKRVAVVAAAAIATGASAEDGEKKTPKDLSHIKCFRCKEPDHYSSSKDCPLHPSKQKAESGAVNST